MWKTQSLHVASLLQYFHKVATRLRFRSRAPASQPARLFSHIRSSIIRGQEFRFFSDHSIMESISGTRSEERTDCLI